MTARFDRLALLATFVRIAERGSLSAAARDLDTSQPSVSRQLAALEDLLGRRLATRTTHSLALTPDGTALLADARRMLGAWDGLTERMGEAGALGGTLRVVAPVALGQRHLMDVAAPFAREHPGVAIDWRLTDRPIRFAEEGCDVWIKVGPVPDDTLVVREVARVERLVVATPDLTERHAGQALPAWPWLALGPFEGSRIMLHTNDGAETAFTIRPRLATDNIFALLEAVRGNLGAAILPRWFVADDLASGTLVDAAPDLRAVRLSINLAMVAGTRRPARVERFVDAVAEWASRAL
ncbi:MAG: LysR family transcriptional regulator [Pseudomonadota bacterium]